ncbi:MAG: hypothetical protein HFE86_08480 [Clostridiales bacterium]|nr:hypothetical protein [Clostridiales bacterium]
MDTPIPDRTPDATRHGNGEITNTWRETSLPAKQRNFPLSKKQQATKKVKTMKNHLFSI